MLLRGSMTGVVKLLPAVATDKSDEYHFPKMVRQRSSASSTISACKHIFWYVAFLVHGSPRHVWERHKAAARG